jgi:hypothetical protein
MEVNKCRTFKQQISNCEKGKSFRGSEFYKSRFLAVAEEV